MYPIPGLFLFWQFICSLLVLLLVSATTIWARKRHPYLTVGWFWFLVTLVPVIGLVQVGSQSMADRYSYLPSIGLFIMAAWGGAALAKDLQYRKVTLALLAGTVIVSTAVLTWQQLVYWRDDVSLFRHALHVTTGNYIMHNTLGAVYVKKGKLDAAIREFQEALAINPNFPDAHNNLGIALVMKGNLEEAIKEFQIALKINPEFSDAHHNLEIALAKKRMHDEARQ